MTTKEQLTLIRDVNVVTIPDGNHGLLHAGDTVTLHQALGNNYTVITAYGHMVQISGLDADALGKEVRQLTTLIAETDVQSVERNCWEVMKTVYDPEIPVNIVELGLVYSCVVTPIAEAKHEVLVKMTLTAPGCGMGPMIQSDVEKNIRNLPGVSKVQVDIVLDPPWSRDMLSEVAKVQLGLF